MTRRQASSECSSSGALWRTPGVQDEHLDRSQLALHASERGVDARLVGHVHHDPERTVDRGLGDVGGDRLRSEVAERLDHPPSDPLGPARHERDPSVDPIQLHRYPSTLCSARCVAARVCRSMASQSSGAPWPGSSERTSSPASIRLPACEQPPDRVDRLVGDHLDRADRSGAREVAVLIGERVGHHEGASIRSDVGGVEDRWRTRRSRSRRCAARRRHRPAHGARPGQRRPRRPPPAWRVASRARPSAASGRAGTGPR